MITKFEKGKRYRFSKEAFIKAESDWKAYECWTKDCLNKEVKVIDETNGKIAMYGIYPEWCVEVEEEI